jgi:hypothetical protein
MLVWLIIVVIMVVSLTVLALLHKSKVSAIEKFQNTSGVLGSTNNAPTTMSSFLASISGGSPTSSSLKSMTTTFTDGQQNYLENILGKEVLTNAAMPNYTNAMTPAVNQPDVYLDIPENIIVRNLQTDNNSQFTNADVTWCKSAQMPANLPPHLKGAAVGCGWYYVPDMNLTSSGALGQVSGPIFPKGPNSDGINGIPNYGNGQWIWDLAIAQQLEEIKNCSRIKSCIAIDAPSVNGVCGFCPPSGAAIPVNIDGTEKYTKSRTIGNITAPAAVCNTKTIMNSGSCPLPPGKEKPLVTPQGIDCGTLGYPSADYSIRLYTKSDCTDKMNGVSIPNGECLMQGGGSYSSACASLNGVAPAGPEPTVCTPDINGRLSAACLVTLAKSLGYTKQGAILKMLQTSTEPGTLDKVAIQIVTGQNVSVSPVLYKGGVTTVSNAIAAYDKLYSLIKGGADPITQQAAMWLCIGTNNFDPCNLPDNTPGPFIDQCVQQQWRIAGCQPGGTEYPSDPSVLNGINTLTWGKVKEIFQNTYNAMRGETDPAKQDIAVMRCLGINTKRSTPSPCVGVTRDGLVIDVDSSSFANADAKSAYTMSGKWNSGDAIYNGPLIASGTKVCDTKGVQFDGTTVLGTPNLVAQVLGLPFSTKILNGPASNLVSSEQQAPSKPPPILKTWFLPIADVGMGVYSTEFHQEAPAFIINIDRSGWQPVFKQINSDIANGLLYKATVTGNNSGIKYSFIVTECTDGTSWNGVFGNSSAKKPTPILFVQDTALQITIEKYVPTVFDPLTPVIEGRSTWGDCGMPPGHIGINTNGDINIPGGYYSAACCSIYIEEDTANELMDAIYKPTSTSQKFKVSFITDKGDVWNGGSLVGLGKAFGNNYAWNLIIERKDGTGNGVGGGTIAPQYQKTTEDSIWWNALLATGGPYYVTVRIEVDNSVVNAKETRELWINPNVDTCEILAILTGPTYTTSYTSIALYKGQLVIALLSNEKGYTFFNAGKVPIAQWSHIVYVYDSGKHEIYINGAGPVAISGLTHRGFNGYLGYSLGGGSSMNPLYQRTPVAMPFKGQIGAFRVYNKALGLTDVQGNLAATVDKYVNQVEFATKNDPNALAMAAGKFYVPMLGNSINYQPNEPSE